MKPSEEMEKEDKEDSESKKFKEVTIDTKNETGTKFSIRYSYPFQKKFKTDEKGRLNETQDKDENERGNEKSIESKFAYSYPFESRAHLKSKLDTIKELDDKDTIEDIRSIKEFNENDQEKNKDEKASYSYPFSKTKRKTFEKQKDPLSSYDYPFRTDFRRSRKKLNKL